MSKHTVAQVEDMIATENDAVVRSMLCEYADLLAENAALRVKLETAGTYEDAYESGYQAGMEEKKPWVGLTDEEVGGLTVFDGLHYIETPLLAEYIRHIQAKLKDKNGG